MATAHRGTCIGTVLLVLSAAAHGQASQTPQPHDSDLDELQVNGARIADVPLLPEPLARTPQSIVTIPEQVIQLQGLSDLRDVLRNASSVSAHADEDNSQGTNVTIRGFSARYDMYLDGQLDYGSYYRDPFFMEEVEVLTGPSSVLFGRGSTGGAIEQDSKRPQTQQFTDGTLSIGTDRLKRITADVNLPVAPGAAFRIAGMAQDGGTAGRDVVRTRRVGAAPSFSVGLGAPLEFTLGYLYQRQWDKPDYGVPWIDIGPVTNISEPANVPARNFYGFPSDYSYVTVSIVTGTLRFTPNEAVSFKNQLRYGAYDQSYREAEPGVKAVIDPDTPLSDVTVTRTERGGIAHQTFLDDQLTMNTRFSTFGLRHSLVAGLEAGRQVSSPEVLKFSGVPGTNLLDPVYQEFTGTSVPSTEVHFTAFTQALFLTDTLHLGNNWEVNAAARLDRFDARYENAVPQLTRLEHLDVIPSWRGALIYRPLSDISLYAMYGTSFDPSAEGLSLSASTADLAPERTHTVELGAKWEPTQYLLASAALFHTVMSNLREASPVDPTVQILAGTARSQGVEFSAQGYLLPRWITLAGYTYLDAAIIASPNGDYGSQLQNAPRHNLRLFNAYDFTPALTVGGTVQFTSSRVPGTVVDPNGYRQRVPGYWVASLLGRYQLAPRVQLQLNLDNLANRRYYDGLDDNHVNVSAGRVARLSLIWVR